MIQEPEKASNVDYQLFARPASQEASSASVSQSLTKHNLPHKTWPLSQVLAQAQQLGRRLRIHFRK
jgi:hypothetical protein